MYVYINLHVCVLFNYYRSLIGLFLHVHVNPKIYFMSIRCYSCTCTLYSTCTCTTIHLHVIYMYYTFVLWTSTLLFNYKLCMYTCAMYMYTMFMFLQVRWPWLHWFLYDLLERDRSRERRGGSDAGHHQPRHKEEEEKVHQLWKTQLRCCQVYTCTHIIHCVRTCTVYCTSTLYMYSICSMLYDVKLHVSFKMYSVQTWQWCTISLYLCLPCFSFLHNCTCNYLHVNTNGLPPPPPPPRTQYAPYYDIELCLHSIPYHRAIPEFSFMDYIKGGCQISLMVAVDFTVSLCKLCHTLY